MMHLEAIKRRNAKPTPQPTARETNQATHDASVNRARMNGNLTSPKRPWDAPDPMPEAKAHPR